VNLKKFFKDLGNYAENPDQYIQAFREVSQNFELSWKDVMLLLLLGPGILFPRETESRRECNQQSRVYWAG
jgi:hypothetical protein